MPLERKPVNWRKLMERKKQSDWGPVSKKVRDLNEEMLGMARAKTGFLPANIVEALVFLGLTKGKAVGHLAKIFVAQGRTKEEAIPLAKRQINLLWVSATRRLATLKKYRIERRK